MHRKVIYVCDTCGEKFDDATECAGHETMMGPYPEYPIGLMTQDGIVGAVRGLWKPNHLVAVEITFAHAANRKVPRSHGNWGSKWAVRHLAENTRPGNTLEPGRCSNGGTIQYWGEHKVPDWYVCDIRRPHFLEMCEWLLGHQPDEPLRYYAGAGEVRELDKAEVLAKIEEYKRLGYWGPLGTQRMKLAGLLGEPEGGWTWLNLSK